MRKVNVREAREHFAEILSQVGAGEVVVLTKRGVEVARIIPPSHAVRDLPSRTAERDAMVRRGARVTTSAVVSMREEDRS